MNNFEGAALLSKIKYSDQDMAEIHDFLGDLALDEKKQIDFFNYCKEWKLAPWISTQLERHSLLEKFSLNVQHLFDEAHLKIKNQNERRNIAAIGFLKEFERNNIDVIILKGNLFAHSVYKDTGYKRMNDFDILIRMKDWDRIQDIYLGLGYIPLGFGWSGEKQKAAKFSHVGMSYLSPDYSCIVGSQWGLKSPVTKYSVDIEKAWETAIDFNFLGVKVKQLSPEYNLLHLVLHMGIHKCGIRDFMDVYNLILGENIDWKKYSVVIKETNAVEKSAFTLRLSEICSGKIVPAVFVSDISENSYTGKRLKKRLKVYEKFGDLHLSYNDYFQDVEKIVIYFNLFPQFHKKLVLYLKILKSIYFPSTEIALKLSDIPNEKSFLKKIFASIKAPYYVFALIAQEIGPKFTFLLFVKLYIDLIISIKNYFVKKESYFDYLRKRGIEPGEIEKLVRNIQ